MKYDINLENIQKIINADTVPEDDSDGLEFDLDDCEVTIKKPYIDKDGDEMGNSIYVDYNDGRVLSFRAQENKYLFVFYRESEQDSFQLLEDNSPPRIMQLALKVWKEITDHMEGPKLSWEAFAAQFGNYEVPALLKQLFAFQEAKGIGSFADGFYLHTIDKTGLKTWSENEAFIQSFIEFSGANGTGSTYAFWITGNDLDKCPIVTFGDEGGIHAIAENILQLIHLLTFDVEIMVTHEDAYYYKSEDYEESTNRKTFLKWVKDHTGFDPIQENEGTEGIIHTAKEHYQPALNKWLTDNNIEI